MVKIARRRGINTFWSRGEQQVFEEASFGTIFLITTLCFLESPLDVLKEAHRILTPGGKIVLGLVLKDSPWGKYYEQKKLEGHPIYKHATFSRCSDVARFTIKAGFTGERIISTLLQKPGEVRYLEEPKEGYYTEAGFVIIVASKPREETSCNTNSG
jgi:SAM-dependent methyltransferase